MQKLLRFSFYLQFSLTNNNIKINFRKNNHRTAKFEIFSVTYLTGGESYRFLDAENESGRRNGLKRWKRWKAIIS